MKRILSISGILGLAFLFMSAITILEAPQDPPKKKKTQKHIKMIKVDEDGKKMELDTIIEGENVFVWKGDTIGGGKELKWISKEDFKLDSLHENFDFDMDFDIDIKEGEDGHVYIMKSGRKKNDPLEIHADSIKYEIRKSGKGTHDVMMWHSDEGNKEMFFHAPNVAGVPPHSARTPKMMFIGDNKKGNVIDLSDPGIIKYDKKKLSGGREKITIIRKEVEEKEHKTHEEIIIHGADEGPVIWHDKAPGKSKAIKIRKTKDGNVEIIEDENVWTVKEGDARVKVIEEDGKIIHIKEIKEGDQKKVEVKVEVKEETENEEKQ